MGRCASDKPFAAGAPRVIGGLFEVPTAESTRPAIPADVTTIAYEVTTARTDPETTITSGTLTPVSSYIFDPVRSGDKFKDDNMPEWNFEHTAPGTFFPTADIDYSVTVKYEFKDSLGNLLGDPLCVTHVVAECLDCDC